MNFETLTLEVANNVATITINRPKAANSINQQFADELSEVAIQCDSDPSIRAVILTGNGRFFSAGGDLSSFADSGEQVSADLKRLTTTFHAAISRFSRMDSPLITVINGPAAGAGFSLAITGDYAIAGKSANFTMAYTAAGLSPDGSSTYFLPRLIGVRKAKELMLTNRALTADEAAEWGLINEVCEDEVLMEQAQKIASKLAVGPTRAYGKVKDMLLTTLSNTLETQMEIETRNIAEMSGSPDGQEGINAFLQKRKPTFSGQ